MRLYPHDVCRGDEPPETVYRHGGEPFAERQCEVVLRGNELLSEVVDVAAQLVVLHQRYVVAEGGDHGVGRVDEVFALLVDKPAERVLAVYDAHGGETARKDVGFVKAGLDDYLAAHVDVTPFRAHLHRREALMEFGGILESGLDDHLALRVDIAPSLLCANGLDIKTYDCHKGNNDRYGGFSHLHSYLRK